MTVATYRSEDLAIDCRYVPVSQLTRWTFENSTLRRWAEDALNGRVLNACCGKTRLSHNDEIRRNDLDGAIDADTHVDAAALPTIYGAEAFDTIVFDPPWSLYQSNLRYDGRHVTKSGDGITVDVDELPFAVDEDKTQVGHARLAKDGFDYLLRPGGTVIQLTQHGTCMPGRMGYQRRERVLFDPIGEAKSVIGSIDMKVQRDMGEWSGGRALGEAQNAE